MSHGAPAGSVPANSVLRMVARCLAEAGLERDDGYSGAEELLAVLDRAGFAIVHTDVIEDAVTALRAESPWAGPDDLYEVMQRVADSLGAALSR